MFAGWLRDHLTAAGLHELSGEEIVRQLGSEQVEAFLKLYEQELWEQKYRKFQNLFPEKHRVVGEGEWSQYYPRSGYPRHMEFFRAGAKSQERCFMAGNRVGKCRSYHDRVPHPDGTSSKIGDLFLRGEPFEVLAWNGSAMVAAPASHVIRKRPEELVELFLSDGWSFTCSLDHVLLTDAGWLHARHLLRSALCLPRSTAEPDPLTRGADAPHWMRTVGGWTAHCSAGRRRYDERPLDELEIVRELRPSPCDAPGRNLGCSPLGDPVRTHGGSLSRSERLLSILYAALLTLGQSVECATQGVCRYAQRMTRSLPIPQQLALVSTSPSQSGGAKHLGLSERRALVSPGMAGNHVVAYRYVGVHALYDMTVPGLHNYVADGVVHHNTVVGGYETTCHLTGIYPDWWEGRRFPGPIRAIAAGDTSETTRDIIQTILFGEVIYEGTRRSVDGTGLVPTELIGRGAGQMAWRRNVDGALAEVKVKHVTGRWSKLNLKSYEQGRKIFQGTTQHLIWVDEEPPIDVYDEARLRTMTVNGMTMLTYTPLEGLTETVLSFLPQDMRPAKDEPLDGGSWGSWYGNGSEDIED